MPQTKAHASSAHKPVEAPKLSEPEKAVKSEEKVDLDEDDDPEEEQEEEEEVEYEEVEEEEEVEETEEEVEEEEEELEEAEEEDANNAIGADPQKNNSGGEMEVEDEDEKKKHAELLAFPPHGSEVYIGGIPHDTSDEDLRVFCESIGEVVKVQIMKGKYSGENKGFAFVTFRSTELASRAIDKLSNNEFKGKRRKCSTSKTKHRLFIGNVPRSWGEEDLRKVVTEIGPGVTAVELVKDVKNTSNNRGFAFVDYYNHACAEHSRQKMMNPQFKLGDNAPTVSWAEPKNADSSATSQVKVIYVKNLPKSVTQDQLKKLFEHHGKITKVVLPPAKSGKEESRIGFIHFTERSIAMKALKNTEKYELDGQVLECSLAKPHVDEKAGGSNSQNSGSLPNYRLHVDLGARYGAAGFAPPMIYGRGPTPGLSMMPMLLPDGRIGYVLQQPRAQPYIPSYQWSVIKGGGGNGSKSSVGSSRGRHNNDGGRGHRHRPY